MPKISKQTLLKLAILAAAIYLGVFLFKDKIFRFYFLWALENNMYTEDKHIEELAADASYFGTEMIDILIERINPETNNGMASRRVAEGALEMLFNGEFDESDLLSHDHSTSEAGYVYEQWRSNWDDVHDRAQWNPETRQIKVK